MGPRDHNGPTVPGPVEPDLLSYELLQTLDADGVNRLATLDFIRVGGDDALQKARKDRSQAAFLIRVLAQEDPHILAVAYRQAMSKGPAWREAIGVALKRLPDIAWQLQLES